MTERDPFDAELERLRAENEKLKALLKDCADDLAAHIEDYYNDTLDFYPSQRLKYERDMKLVMDARAALKEGK